MWDSNPLPLVREDTEHWPGPSSGAKYFLPEMGKIPSMKISFFVSVWKQIQFKIDLIKWEKIRMTIWKEENPNNLLVSF